MFKLPAEVGAAIAALRFSEPDTRSLAKLSSADWTNLLIGHELVRLTLPLRQTSSEQMPLWVRSRIDGYIADNVVRLERIKAAYSEIADALRDVCADHIVIKGFAQWPGFNDHPCFHLQSDIDLYCPPESIESAHQAILALRYEPARDERRRQRDHLPALIRRGGWHWNGNYFDPEMPPSIELHFCFWNTAKFRFGLPIEEAFWNRRINRQLDGMQFPALSLTDNLGCAALHILRDWLEDKGSIVKLYQIARFLHFSRYDEDFWASWSEQHCESLRHMEAIPFCAAHEIFGCALSEPVQRAISELAPSVKKWLGCFGGRLFDQRLHKPRAGIWLHLALLESARERWELGVRHFLPYRPISLRAFSDREQVKGGMQGEATTSSVRRKWVRHLQEQASARARAFVPTLIHGIRYWCTTKALDRNYWTLYSTSFLFDLGMFIFFLLYNLVLIDKGFNAQFLGLIASAGALGSVAGTAASGVLAHRIGLRKSLLICVPAAAAIFSARAIVGNAAALVCLAFAGMAAAAMWGVNFCPAVAQMTNDENRPFGFSVILSSGIAVGILGGFTGGHLPGWLFRLRVHPALKAESAALLVGCALVALATWPISRLRFTSTHVKPRTVYPWSRFLARFLPAIAVWSLVTGGFSPFFNAFFSQRFHMPAERIGTLFSASQLAQVAAILIAPALFRRAGLVRGVMVTQILAGVALACLAIAPAGFCAAACYTLFSAFEWMNEPGIFTLLMSRVRPEEQAGASALMFLVISLSQAAAGALAGAGFVRLGYPTVLLITAGAAVAAAALFGQLLHGESIEGNAATGERVCLRSADAATLPEVAQPLVSRKASLHSINPEPIHRPDAGSHSPLLRRAAE